MISPSSARARFIPSSLLPEAVGPTMTGTIGLAILPTNAMVSIDRNHSQASYEFCLHSYRFFYLRRVPGLLKTSSLIETDSVCKLPRGHSFLPFRLQFFNA